MPDRYILATLAGLLAALGQFSAGHAAPPLVPQSCLRELSRVAPASGDLVCEHPAWLTDEERADLRRLTREMLQDASCVVRVRIPRARINAAIETPDNVFQSPPQPVTCEIKTKESQITISGTFAPRVVFKGGRAVEAVPGLGDVKGVSSYLSWPVVQYVNRAPGIQTEMVRMINLWLERSGRGMASR